MKEIEQSLDKTIDSSNLEGLTTDFAEIALDSVMEDGILKEIPVFGTIFKVAKLGVNVNDFLLYKKVFKFLFQIKDISLDKRQQFYENIKETEDYNKNVGEAVLLLLDKLDDMEKPAIIGKLFAETLNGNLDYKTFLRLSYIVERMFAPDIQELRKVKNGQPVELDTKSNLYNLGLMSRQILNNIRGNSSNEYVINNFGETLVEILYKE